MVDYQSVTADAGKRPFAPWIPELVSSRRRLVASSSRRVVAFSQGRAGCGGNPRGPHHYSVRGRSWAPTTRRGEHVVLSGGESTGRAPERGSSFGGEILLQHKEG